MPSSWCGPLTFNFLNLGAACEAAAAAVAAAFLARLAGWLVRTGARHRRSFLFHTRVKGEIT